MLVRHGEKQPDSGPPPYGVNEAGEVDKHSLIVRGWQRAGALVPFFRRPWVRGIETPEAVYASKVGDEALIADGHDISKSLRPQQTVTPLCRALALKDGLQTPYPVGQESQLVQTVIDSESGVVLIAWEHNHIPPIAQGFGAQAPSQWPDKCFDAVWILTKSGDNYEFQEVRQGLLDGDDGG